MKREYSQEIANAILAYIKSNGWEKYTFDQETGLIRMQFSTKCSLNHVRIVFDLHETFFITYGCADMNVAEANRGEVAEYLTRANYAINFGNFEMDMSDGEVRYKYAVDCNQAIPSTQVIDRTVDVPLVMFNRYGNDLVKVMFGFESAEEGCNNAEAEWRK